MPHFPKPFFRVARGVWFLQLHGKWINLGPDKGAAFSRYHQLMARPETAVVPPAEAARLVVVVVDDFLEWCQKHRRPDTYRWYKDRLSEFCGRLRPLSRVTRDSPKTTPQRVPSSSAMSTLSA